MNDKFCNCESENSKQIKSWNEDDWNEHRIIFTRLAQPKKELVCISSIRQKRPLKDLKKNIEKLSTPRRYFYFDDKKVSKKNIHLSESKIEYLRQLSKPKFLTKKFNGEIKENIWKLSDKLKNFKASENLIKISTPKHVYSKFQSHKNPENECRYQSTIKPKTLSYIPTKRIKMLAVPRIYFKLQQNKFAVKRGALRAKATCRIQRLALPKEIYYSCFCGPKILVQ